MADDRTPQAYMHAIDAWLRSEPDRVLAAGRQHGSWELRADHALLPDRWVQLALPVGFPAEPPEVFVRKNLCLVLPHVEATGRVCLGLEVFPSDHEDPVAPVARALRSLEELLANSMDAAWRRHEFAREAVSYWEARCRLARKASHARTVPIVIDADAGGLDTFAEGRLGLWTVGRQRDQRTTYLLAALGAADPETVASRHQRPSGTYTSGRALFIRLHEAVTWTPDVWPSTIDELEALIQSGCHEELDLRSWLSACKQGRHRPCAIVLLHGSAAYGYLLIPAFVPGLGPPGLLPIAVRRIDADWALARDQQLDVLHLRRQSKVLLLGVGSLGASVAEHLARSGIGHLTLVDEDEFRVENTARHVLGMTSMGLNKADAIAKRLRSEIPHIHVTAAIVCAAQFLERQVRPGAFDVVVDCTAESSVRTLLAVHRDDRLDGSSVVMAWVEPFCAATHVVALDALSRWPADDPADDAVNVVAWADQTRVEIARCGAGFHPYASADIGQSAAFAAERIVSVVDGRAQLPTVWTRMRSREFLAALPVHVEPRALVPSLGSSFASLEIERDFHEVVGSNAA